jgi:hypothetical protein
VRPLGLVRAYTPPRLHSLRAIVPTVHWRTIALATGDLSETSAVAREGASLSERISCGRCLPFPATSMRGAVLLLADEA